MHVKTSEFDIEIADQQDLLSIKVSGEYSLAKAKHLFSSSIDNALLHKKSRILIDVTQVSGNIPFMDRFEYSEFLAKYRAQHAFTEVNKIAVVGEEPIVHREKFGETVAVNRGADVKVFTNMNEALVWLDVKN